jgi:plastocyanin domain-containing protein
MVLFGKPTQKTHTLKLFLKMNKVITILSVSMVIGLLLWNVFLINKNQDLLTNNQLLEIKFQTQQGEIDILTYDLVTTRDSLRILLSTLDSIPVIQKEFY